MSERAILRTPLGRAVGLGSAKEGVAHWWAQRLTAVALVPLLLWFAAALIAHVGAPRAAAVAWLASPFTVSYMCQRQSSSPILPRAAPMPPCAATVCERVGNTLVRHAVLSPAMVVPSVARKPAPPAPTTTTS